MKINFKPFSGILSLWIIPFMISFTIFTTAAGKAPWGFNQMQVGLQKSAFKYTDNWTVGGNPCYTTRNNFGLGINARVRVSFLDLLIYGDDNRLSNSKLRIVDLIGFEFGAGYLRDHVKNSDQLSEYEKTHQTLWHNVGIELGFAAMYRIIPRLDLGFKYSYLSNQNGTFGETHYVRQDNGDLVKGNSGRDLFGYGNKFNWGLMARFGKFYGEIFFSKTKDGFKTNVTIFDLKYIYKDPGTKTWAQYVGLQIGGGKTPFINFHSSGSSGVFHRSWVQLSIGKMTNF